MHVADQLHQSLFDVCLGENKGIPSDIFPDWHSHDRFGLVMDEAFGGLGATHLLQLAISLYYDVKPSRRAELKVYPEIYSFHIGKGHGAHAGFDFWPTRREIIISSDDSREVLDAINNCGITRLAVPNRPSRDIVHRPKEVDAALDRIVSAFVYDASGRIEPSDFSIRGNDRRTEQNPVRVIRPVIVRRPPGLADSTPFKESDPDFVHWIQARSGDVTEDDRKRAETRRAALKIGGLATETYRYTTIEDALSRL